MPSALIGKMISILVVWLHAKVGISCSVANKALQALQLIFMTILHILEAALLSFGATVRLSDMNIPCDVQTAYWLHFTDIIHTACCPKCCSLIAHPIPWQCQWRASPRSCSCNTELVFQSSVKSSFFLQNKATGNCNWSRQIQILKDYNQTLKDQS